MLILGDKLKALRKAKGLTQIQVAERLGLSKAVISSYEVSGRSPSYDILIKLAYLYGVSTDYLLGVETRRTIDVSNLTEKQIDAVINMIDAIKHP
ncbi:helix-turn-helix domain-containing protein [Anaerocolumna sp.]|uniref:helix-turn-helix domain-containing protein n=1 Tax=Anaerocolumna sp. TaxID=2041569 RepID=UPI0028AD7A0F|nr:helix-turn-helix transcriptional regulator [Anaerocolumna sp.]